MSAWYYLEELEELDIRYTIKPTPAKAAANSPIFRYILSSRDIMSLTCLKQKNQHLNKADETLSELRTEFCTIFYTLHVLNKV